MSSREQSPVRRWFTTVMQWCFPKGRFSGVAFAEGETIANDAPGAVRSAGPEAMRDPPKEWDEIDEALDETFPASDPLPYMRRRKSAAQQ